MRYDLLLVQSIAYQNMRFIKFAHHKIIVCIIALKVRPLQAQQQTVLITSTSRSPLFINTAE